MALGTPDGQVYEDQFDYLINSLAPKLNKQQDEGTKEFERQKEEILDKDRVPAPAHGNTISGGDRIMSSGEGRTVELRNPASRNNLSSSVGAEIDLLDAMYEGRWPAFDKPPLPLLKRKGPGKESPNGPSIDADKEDVVGQQIMPGQRRLPNTIDSPTQDPPLHDWPQLPSPKPGQKFAGLLNWLGLKGEEKSKEIPADVLSSFPTEGQDIGYGTNLEGLLKGQIRTAGHDVFEDGRITFKQESLRGSLKNIFERLPATFASKVVEHPELVNQLGGVASAINRSAIASLGFDPGKIVFDKNSYGNKMTIGGAYSPGKDMMFASGMSAIVHESIHRGIAKIRKEKPELFETMPNEELIVRYLMYKHLGNPEKGDGKVGDQQIDSAVERFEKSISSTGYVKGLHAIEKAAQELIQKQRPRRGASLTDESPDSIEAGQQYASMVRPGTYKDALTEMSGRIGAGGGGGRLVVLNKPSNTNNPRADLSDKDKYITAIKDSLSRRQAEKDAKEKFTSSSKDWNKTADDLSKWAKDQERGKTPKGWDINELKAEGPKTAAEWDKISKSAEARYNYSVWKQGEIKGYQDQIDKMMKAKNPDLQQIKGLKEYLEYFKKNF